MITKTAMKFCIACAIVGPGLLMSLALAQQPGSAPAATAPLAVTDGQQPGIRLEVTELKRGSGDTVTLKFTLINASSEPFTLGSKLRSFGSGSTVSGIYLLDAANRTKYQVIADAEKKCVCSADIPSSVEAGSSINLWAKFPAPPAAVTEVGVVVPHFIPMDGVPIAS